MALLTRLTIGMAVALLMIAGCRYTAAATPHGHSVFTVDQVLPLFSTLESRKCLPAGLHSWLEYSSDNKWLVEKCATKVTGAGLTDECDGAPTLARFYNCLAFGLGGLGKEATSFDITAMNNELLSHNKINDKEWNDMAVRLLATCKRTSPASLMPRQQAVYNFMCNNLLLFSDCDRQQAEEGRLDEAGALRQAHFLSGDCPLSPSTLLDSYGMITNRTWEECSQALYTGDNTTLLHAAEVSRVVCLLQEFSNDLGNVDFPKLKSVVRHRDNFLDFLLLSLTEKCNDVKLKQTGPGPNKHPEMTIKEFVKCWATEGVFSCALQEAKQVASSFPETCAISVVN